MDWYLIGRILGVFFWPGLVGVSVYGLGWALSLSRAPLVAVEIRHWTRVAAFAGFFLTLFITGRDFVKFAGGAS